MSWWWDFPWNQIVWRNVEHYKQCVFTEGSLLIQEQEWEGHCTMSSCDVPRQLRVRKCWKNELFFYLGNFFSIHFTYQPFPLPPLLLSPPLSHLSPFPSTSPPSPKNDFLHTTLGHEIYSWILIQCRNTGTSLFKKLYHPTSAKQVVPPITYLGGNKRCSCRRSKKWNITGKLQPHGNTQK